MNKLLGFEAVEIVNIAAGGMNSKVGEQVIHFNLYPDSFLPEGPDIIVNAFSTNDMHINSMNEASFYNKTLSQSVFDICQSFIRKVLNLHCTSPPLLIFVDDYLGNEQERINDLMVFHNSISQLSSYYNVMSISYADVVRIMVYGDVEGENWFSPSWLDKYKWTRQIHPGMGMHISMLWIMAFNALNAVVSFCNQEAFGHCLKDLHVCNDIFPSQGMTEEIQGKAKPFPRSIPPPLTDELRLQDITKLWRVEEENFQRECKSNHGNTCIFSWISTILLGSPKLKALEKKLHPVIFENDGWAVNEEGALGISPEREVGSKLIFKLGSHDKEVRTIYVLALRSYGDDWEGSNAHFSVFRDNEISQDPIYEEEISGHHRAKISVTYTYKFDLKENFIAKGMEGRLVVHHTAGKKFKITGLAFCSH